MPRLNTCHGKAALSGRMPGDAFLQGDLAAVLQAR